MPALWRELGMPNASPQAVIAISELTPGDNKEIVHLHSWLEKYKPYIY